MKVLLINPPIKKVLEKQYDTPEYPHIGIAYLSGSMEYNKIDFDVIDCKLERYSCDDLFNNINIKKYNIIGLTSFTHEIKYVHSIANIIKKIKNEIKIVIGGAHAAGCGKQVLEEFTGFDIAVPGEGEKTFCDLIKSIEEKNEPSAIKGIIYRNEKGDIVDNGPAGYIEELDDLPEPAYHLFPPAKRYYIITSRGCPFKCLFCSRQHGSRMRYRSIEKVVNEFSYLINNYNPEYIIFSDENFTIDRLRTEKLADTIIEKNLHKKVEWEAQTHVTLTDRDLMEKMYKAGCKHICFGIESGNEDILKNLNKSSSLEKAFNTVKTAKEIGFRVELNCIIGHPYETKKTAFDTIDFVTKLNPYLPVFGIMIPYPGTEISRLALKGEGDYTFISKDWDDYNKQLGSALELKKINRVELKLLQLYGYIKVYLWNLRFADFIRFCWKYRSEAAAYIKNVFKLLIK